MSVELIIRGTGHDGNHSEMAISTDPNDPHFGLETDVASPNFGLPQEEPKSVVENALAGAGDVLKGFAQQFVPKFDLKTLAGLAYGPINAQIQGYNALKGVADTVEQVHAAEQTEPFSRERFAAGLNVAGQLGLIALGGLKKPTLREVALGETPEVMPQIPETPVPDVATPVIPEERFPSLLRSDENLRRGELQQQLNKERGFELVPEPPPDISPAPTIEQTLETAQVPEPRVSPETGFEFPNEPETRTNVPSETARIGGEINAVQEPSTREVLQRQPEEAGTTRGERVGVEPSVQGKETPQAQPEAVPQAGEIAPEVPQPEQIPAETTPQLEDQPEIPTSGVHAEALAERPIDTIPPGEEIGWQDARKLGNDFLDKGGSINKVMADFNRTGKLSVKDIGAGRAYLERLQAVTDRTQDALRENPTDPVLQQNYGAARAAEQRFSEDYKPMATAASNQLKGFQGKIPLTDDMADSFTSLSRKYGEIQGKPMTPEEVVKADRIAKQNAKTKADYGAANDELYRKIDTEYGRIRTTRKAPPTLEDLGKTFGQALKEVCET